MTEVTDREPTPHTHTVGWGDREEASAESTRAGAPARARTLSVPPVPTLARNLFVGDPESSTAEFWREFLRRCRLRTDYALHGEWCAPNPFVVDEDGVPVVDDEGQPVEDILGIRWAYLWLFTIPIAIPIAFALDFLDWATHPAGRLLATVFVVWLIAALI